MKHEIYKTGDDNTPDSIKDNNEDVVLSLYGVISSGDGDEWEDAK